jgi:hypothetical protein
MVLELEPKMLENDIFLGKVVWDWGFIGNSLSVPNQVTQNWV